MPTLSLPPQPPMPEPDLPPSYTPQATADLLPIYNPQNTNNHVETYTFSQKSPSTQTITLKDPSTNSSSNYQIKTFATGGFMNKKPHIIIHKTRASPPPPFESSTTRENHDPVTTSNTPRRFSLLPRKPSDTPTPPPSQPPETYTSCSSSIPFAEVRFDIHGTGTSLDYTSTFSPSPPHHRKQRLELHSSQNQTLATTISSHPRYWRPFPGNRSVLELVTEAEEIVARFVHTVPTSDTNLGVGGKKKKMVVGKGVEFGELEIVEEYCGGERGSEGAKEEILCSAVAVIERARRRASNINRAGVGYKQGAACGPTMGAYGGGVGC